MYALQGVGCVIASDKFILKVVPESGFEVTRRILVDFEGISLRKKFSNGLEPNSIHMMIGVYVFTCLSFN